MWDRIPDSWQLTELEKVCTLPVRQVRPTEFSEFESYVGLENIESDTGMINEYKRVDEAKLKSSKFPFDNKCILYGKLRPYLNKVALPEITGICSTDILPLKPLPEVISREFLYFFLRSPYFVRMATEKSTGANLPRITPKSLLKMPVPVPPLQIQRQIARLLMKADHLLRNRRHSTELLTKVPVAAFRRLFGEPSSNPRKWKTETLESLVVDGPIHGKSLERARVRAEPPGVSVLKLGALSENGLDFRQVKYYDESLPDVDRWILKPDDILISRSNTMDLVGRVGRYAGYPSPCIISDLMIRVRANPNIVEPAFLEFYLREPFVRTFFQSRARGTSGSMPKISNSDVREVPVRVPPLPLQKEFVRIVLGTESLGKMHDKSTEEINELFHSLMHKAFRGELRTAKAS